MQNSILCNIINVSVIQGIYSTVPSSVASSYDSGVLSGSGGVGEGGLSKKMCKS